MVTISDLSDIVTFSLFLDTKKRPRFEEMLQTVAACPFDST